MAQSIQYQKMHGVATDPRTGMLSLQCVSQEAQQISRRNSTLSPLFRLPLEIRRQIYRCVLGGQRIRIDNPDACFMPENNEINPIERVVGTVRAPWDHRRFPPLMPVDLRFLRVSRQAYYEAAVVPYTYNCFDFTQPADGWMMPSTLLGFWIARLRPAQRAAVTCIVITLGTVLDIRHPRFGGTALTTTFPRLAKVVVRMIACADAIRGAEMVMTGPRADEIVREVKRNEKKGLRVNVIIVLDG